MKRMSITKKKRHKIYNRDNYKCLWCNVEIDIETATLDHLVPYSLGGNNGYKNLITCCQECNVAKDTMDCISFSKVIGKKTGEYYGYIMSRIYNQVSKKPKKTGIVRWSEVKIK